MGVAAVAAAVVVTVGDDGWRIEWTVVQCATEHWTIADHQSVDDQSAVVVDHSDVDWVKADLVWHYGPVLSSTDTVVVAAVGGGRGGAHHWACLPYHCSVMASALEYCRP